MKEKQEYTCPNCGSTHTYSNGRTKQDKPKRHCQDCGKYFVIGLERRKISEDTWQLAWRMVDEEGVSLKGASRLLNINYGYLKQRNRQRLQEVSMEIENEPVDLSKKKHSPSA